METHWPKISWESFNPRENKVLVALSGGADSVALLRMLQAEGVDIEALHCNFRLRHEESNRDEQFVEELCRKLQVPLYTKHFDTVTFAKSERISIEMAARQQRYEWFEEMRLRLKADVIAVAHHRDDQVETVLLNLIRGTGLRGLTGMQPRNGNIVRPLLQWSRKDILAYLQSIGQDYVTDSTNLCRDAQRNQLRLDVIPLLESINPKASQHIAQTAQYVAEALPYYLKGVAQAEDQETNGEVTATQLHERLQGMKFTASQEAEMLHSQRSGALFESATHRATFHQGQLVVEAKDEVLDTPTLKTEYVEIEHEELRNTPSHIAYIDADKLSLPLVLRHPQNGDRFRPLGMQQGSRLLSDFLTEQHLSIFEKERQWLVCHGEDIVWVVDHRIDQRFRVTPQTKRVVRLTVVK